MTHVTPRIPSGFMELLPAEQLLFNRMVDIIRKTYELYGFTPIETPAIELSEVLFAKGGGETEKQIYNVKNGQDGEEGNLALHFDLTVPLARYVAEHQNDLALPFRRYQIQKVWRGERPQRGRFREFYQCDIDIVGTREPITDAEVLSVINATFTALGFERFTIRINNRKILMGIFSELGLEGKVTEMLRIVDKIEKIGAAAVRSELNAAGATADDATKITDFIAITGTNDEVFANLASAPFNSELYAQGVAELRQVYDLTASLGVPKDNVSVDLTIARGLDYYTGTVYETVLDDYAKVGSICSGGRYDDLAGYYTDTELPGVGVSIGLTRLFWQLKDAGLLAASASSPAKVLVIAADRSLMSHALEAATSLRAATIPTEVYLEDAKMGKQLKYANKIGVPYAVIIGEKEIAAGVVTLRDLATGDQAEFTLSELIAKLEA